MNPFALPSMTQRVSQVLFYQWIAPMYKSGVSDDISVVLWVDSDLEDKSWPVDYDFHATILSTILVNKPKAVMVNIGFIDPKRNDDTLSDLANVLKEEKSVPIFLAATDPTEQLPRGVLDELANIVTPVFTPPAGRNSYGIRYFMSDSELEKARKQNVVDVQPSAAWAMYSKIRENQESGRSEPDFGEKIDDVMYLTWGLFKREENNGPFDCQLEDNSPFDLSVVYRIWKTITYQFSRFYEDVSTLNTSKESNVILRDACPPHQTMSVDYLLYGDQDEIKQAIKGKFVFYGAYLNMTSGRVVPPTHFPLPEVYFHTMALDNLLRYGDDYIREDKQLFGGRLSLSQITIAIVFLSLLVISESSKFLLEGLGHGKDLNSEESVEPNGVTSVSQWNCFLRMLIIAIPVIAASWILQLSVVAGAVCLSFFYFHIAPLDFVGLLSMVAVKSSPRFIRNCELFTKRVFPCFFDR